MDRPWAKAPASRQTVVARPRRRTVWLLAVLCTFVVGLVTMAVWDGDDDSAVRAAGDADFTLGTLTWRCPTQSTSGSGAWSLAGLPLGDGDVLVIDQLIVTHLKGSDDLQVAMSVTWPGLPGDAAAAWVVADAGGTQVAPPDGYATLSQTLNPPGVVAAAKTWHVLVTLTLPVGSAAYVDPTATAKVTGVDFGALTIAADHVEGDR